MHAIVALESKRIDDACTYIQAPEQTLILNLHIKINLRLSYRYTVAVTRVI